MNKLKFCLILTLLSGVGFSLWGAPARPVKHTYVQPDGSTLSIYLRGDEFFHYYETEDEVILQKEEDGFFRYAVVSSTGKIEAGKYIAHNPAERSAQEQSFLKNLDREKVRKAIAAEYDLKRRSFGLRTTPACSSPGEIPITFPTMGTVRGLVIMAEYQDIKFSRKATREVYEKLVNEEGYTGEYASGSVRDYFISQSQGAFTPIFDVVGPVTLPNDRKYYGLGQGSRGEKTNDMVIDACVLADEEFDVDFSRYDSNGDGTVDFIYIVYAGCGQAQGGPEESVWPKSDDLTYSSWKTYDGMYLGRYSCSCELRGAEEKDEEKIELDGIGTFCHEFSHILGLPDIYDPLYSGCYGFGNWDVMDVGSYNNNSKTPAGYTAMDKYTVGWLKPTILEETSKNIPLEALGTSNKAYFIVSPHDANEYYTLENRQNTGWDEYLPGHGLLISHIHYDRALWDANRVNTTSSKYEHVELIAADNVKSGESEAGDVYPGTSGNTEFTDTSTPAAYWHNGKAVGMPITNIQEKDGVIYFDFFTTVGISDPVKSDEKNIEIISYQGAIYISNPQGKTVTVYSIEGKTIKTFYDKVYELSLEEGIYIVRTDEEVWKIRNNR